MIKLSIVLTIFFLAGCMSSTTRQTKPQVENPTQLACLVSENKVGDSRESVIFSLDLKKVIIGTETLTCTGSEHFCYTHARKGDEHTFYKFLIFNNSASSDIVVIKDEMIKSNDQVKYKCEKQ